MVILALALPTPGAPTLRCPATGFRSGGDGGVSGGVRYCSEACSRAHGEPTSPSAGACVLSRLPRSLNGCLGAWDITIACCRSCGGQPAWCAAQSAGHGLTSLSPSWNTHTVLVFQLPHLAVKGWNGGRAGSCTGVPPCAQCALHTSRHAGAWWRPACGCSNDGYPINGLRRKISYLCCACKSFCARLGKCWARILVTRPQCFWPSWQLWRWAGDEDCCRVQISPISWRWHIEDWRNAGEPPLRLAQRSGHMRRRCCFVGTCLPFGGLGAKPPASWRLFNTME